MNLHSHVSLSNAMSPVPGMHFQSMEEQMMQLPDFFFTSTSKCTNRHNADTSRV